MLGVASTITVAVYEIIKLQQKQQALQFAANVICNKGRIYIANADIFVVSSQNELWDKK